MTNKQQSTNEPEYKHPQLIQSYVKRQWLVSTGYRQSSATVNSPPCYYETIIWEWDAKARELGKMLNMIDSGGYEAAALKSHFGIVTRLAQSQPELEPEDIRRDRNDTENELGKSIRESAKEMNERIEKMRESFRIDPKILQQPIGGFQNDRIKRMRRPTE